MRRFENVKASTWMTLVLLVMSIGANVLQARKIFDLADPAVPRHSRVGQTAAPVLVRTPAGEARRLTFTQGPPTVLYFFSPTCGWCERNWANVQALANGAQGRFRVVAVSSETDLRAFVRRHPLQNIEVYGGLSPDAHRDLGLSSTPHTLVISAQGLVSHDWLGAFQGSSARALEDLFEIVLPGVQTKPPAPTTR